MDKIANKIVPIFFLSLTGATITSGVIFVNNSLGESLTLMTKPSPQPVSAINPQPVKTIVTIMKPSTPTSDVQVKSATAITTTSAPVVTSNSPAAYTIPEPSRYIALGGSSTAPSNYANVPNAAPSQYQTPPVSTSTATYSQSSTASQTSQAKPTAVVKTASTNGNGAKSISLTSSSSNSLAQISASQFSSGSDNATGSIYLSAEISE